MNIFRPQGIHNRCIIITIVCIVMFGFAVPIHHAKAIVPVFDAAVLAALEEIAGIELDVAASLDALVVKEYSLDPIVDMVASETTTFWEDEIVSWITVGEGEGVGFVNHLETLLGNEVKQRADEFMSRIENINLCSPDLKLLLKFRLSLPQFNFKLMIPQFKCTVITVGDVADFYRDFNNGGWETFIETNLIPNNNPFMLSYKAEANRALAQADKADTFNQKTETNQGFQGQTEDVKADVCELDEQGEPECFTEKKIHTPGGLIASALEKTLKDNGFDKTMSSDELSELLTSMLDGIIKGMFGKLMSGLVF